MVVLAETETLRLQADAIATSINTRTILQGTANVLMRQPEAKEQLEAAGYEVEDCVLTTRDEVEYFKERNGVDTTPLIVIGDEPIGGMAELEGFLAADCEQT